MTQRGGDEPVRDAAALQELAAGVVHGVYRTVKACQFHADVSNDAVTGLTAAAASAVAAYCARAGTETVALSFLGDAIFVNRQILKASRDTHALAAELRDMLEVCEVTELTLAKNVDRAPADAISCYWVTNTATSSSRSYWEGAQAGGGPFDAFDIRSRSRCSRPIYRVKNLGKEEHRQPHLLERGAAGSGEAAC